MMNIEAVIFDMDGVLVHTDRLHYRAWKKICDENGIYYDENTAMRLRGVSRRESLEIILSKCGMDSMPEKKKSELMDEKNRIFLSYLEGLAPDDVSEEIRDTLTELKSRGLRLGIGSSSRNVSMIIDKTGLGSYFDAVADGTMAVRTKPDPEVFLLAAKMLGVLPECCLVVEDSEAGIRAAGACGMRTVIYGNGGGDIPADYVLTRFSDLKDIISLDK